MQSIILWLCVLSDLLLLMAVFVIANGHRHRVRLKKQRDTLLKEKEATLGFVHNVGEVFADAENIELNELLDRVLHYAVRTCNATSGAIHLINAAHTQLEARAVSGIFPPPFETDTIQETLKEGTAETIEKTIREMPILLGMGLIGQTAAHGHAVLVEDAELDSRVPRFHLNLLQIRTLLVLPMRFGNHTIGVMTLVNRVDGKRFSLANLNLAQALAAQASVPIHYAGLQEALEYKRQIDRDMKIAKQIQSSLLPQHLPTCSSIDLSAFSLPAMEIGGDYYDGIQIDDRHICLVIADVSGKGVGGALMMAVCRSVLRVNAPNIYNPSDMLCALNKTLSSNLAEDMFISMLYMVLNVETHQLSFARAGHEAPILLRNGSQKPERIETAGIAIGLVDQDIFEEAIETKNITLESGDLLLAYTDGISEAMNPEGEEWGLDRLLHATERLAGNSTQEILGEIRKEVVAFAADNRQYDDMTMLALKINSPQ